MLVVCVLFMSFPYYLKLFALRECGKVLSFQSSELALKTRDSLPGLMKVIYCLLHVLYFSKMYLIKLPDDGGLTLR